MLRSFPASGVDWRDPWVTDWLWLHTSKKWTTLLARQENKYKEGHHSRHRQHCHQHLRLHCRQHCNQYCRHIVFNIVSNCQQFSAIANSVSKVCIDSIVNIVLHLAHSLCQFLISFIDTMQILCQNPPLETVFVLGGKLFLSSSRRISLVRLLRKRRNRIF